MSRGIRSGGGAPKSLVTYYVDIGESYQEEVGYNQTILSPETFTPAKTGYTFRGWRQDGNPRSEVLTDMPAKGKKYFLYAVFEKTITVTYYDLSSAASIATDYQYYNNTNISNDPEFTLTQKAYSGWTARGWTTSSSGGSSTIAYQSGVPFTRNSDVTLYGCYERTVSVTYNANGGTGTTAASTGTAYHHSTSGATNASITLRDSGYSKLLNVFANWRFNNPNGTVYNAGGTYSSTADCTMYAYWVPQAIISNGYISSSGSQVISSSAQVVNNKENVPGYPGKVTPTGTYSVYTVDSVGYLGDENPIYGYNASMSPYYGEDFDGAFNGSLTITINFASSVVGKTCSFKWYLKMSCRSPSGLPKCKVNVKYGSTTLADVSSKIAVGGLTETGTNSFTIESGKPLVLHIEDDGYSVAWAASFWAGIRNMTIS